MPETRPLIRMCFLFCINFVFFCVIADDLPGSDVTDVAARQAMQQATNYFTSQVSTEGGYLWKYSQDLKDREGENRAPASRVWVQPPGTPSVGEAYLRAYQKTGEPYLLKAAKSAAYALVNGQLKSGGWNYYIDFEDRKSYQYRVNGGGPKARNITTLDDNTTQAALRFLILMDQELKFQDHSIHEAAMYALNALLKAQYPNGGWPQRFDSPPDPKDYPVIKANYPESWSREFPKKKYLNYYTFINGPL